MTEAGGAKGPAEDWPPPIPLGPGKPAPLPLEPLPAWVRQQVESVSASTQTPSDLAVLQGLAAISTALANKGVVRVRRGYREPLHVWTAVVLPPASRKSSVHGHMVGPIYRHEAERAQATQEDRQMVVHRREAVENALKSAKQDLAEAVEDQDEGDARQRVKELQEQLNELPDPGAPRLLASDVTAEKLTQLMAEHHGRIAVLEPEGEIFRLMAGRYRSGGPNFDPHKKAWTGDEPIRDDRIGREGSHVRRPALTLGVCVQPSVFDTLEHQGSFRGEGVLARFLVAVPESGIGTRLTGDQVPELDEAAEETYSNRLRTLLELEPKQITQEDDYEPHSLTLSAGAREELNRFDADVEPQLGSGGRLSPIQDWGR